MSKKSTDQVLKEVENFLRKETDVYDNPDLSVNLKEDGFAPSIIVFSRTRFVGILAEHGTGGRYLVIKVFYGIGDDLNQETAAETGVVQGNDYFIWSDDDTFWGRLAFGKDKEKKAKQTKNELANLLNGWIDEVHLIHSEY